MLEKLLGKTINNRVITKVIDLEDNAAVVVQFENTNTGKLIGYLEASRLANSKDTE